MESSSPIGRVESACATAFESDTNPYRTPYSTRNGSKTARAEYGAPGIPRKSETFVECAPIPPFYDSAPKGRNVGKWNARRCK